MLTSIAFYIQTPWRKKLTIVGVFGIRVFVVAAVACQLFYSNQPVSDPAFDLWPASISTQVVQCLSITTACIPYLKPFLDSLESGLMRADDLRRRGGTSAGSYNISDVPKSSGAKSAQSRVGKVVSKVANASRRVSERHDTPTIPLGNLSPVPATLMFIEGERHDWDGQSQSSQTRIIRETRTWRVDIQDSGAQN